MIQVTGSDHQHILLDMLCVLSFYSMPRTTGSKRQAQPTVTPSSKRRTRSSNIALHHTNALPTTSASISSSNIPNSGDVANSHAASATTTGSSLAPDTIKHLAAAVSQAVINALSVTPVGQPSTMGPGTSLSESPLQSNNLSQAGDCVATDAIVQGSVASVISSLSGEAVPVVSQPADRPQVLFSSMSIPLHARVPNKIKSKIWANEYFDFGLLLSSSPVEPHYNLSINPSQESSGLPTLCLESTHKAKPIFSIEAWISAFQIFVAVYTSKYQTEAPELMKYGEVVRDLAAKGANWKYYDSNFRYLRQQQPSNMPWGAVHWELWIRSQHFQAKPGTSKYVAKPVAPRAQDSKFVPKGFCRKFHSGGNCAGCTYKHECPKCHSVHPACNCNFRPSGANKTKSSTAVGSRTPYPSQNK